MTQTQVVSLLELVSFLIITTHIKCHNYSTTHIYIK